MNIVIDMNLTPLWIPVLQEAGHSAVHWSAVGSSCAKDSEILKWARDERYVVFTHDLDFGAILAATVADSPSVIQIRTQDPVPDCCGRMLLDVLQRFSKVLDAGALISVDENRARVHILPLARS